jgi:Domain of unknown function (DUF3883)
MSDRRHGNYELLNLLAYGLAKFSKDFVQQFGFSDYTAFYNHLINLGVCDTGSSIRNRRDLIDPFFDNDRVGFVSRGDTYRHRKDSIELLFGKNLDVKTFADIVKLYLVDKFNIGELKEIEASPIIKSKFKQLQETGKEAELYFLSNYQQIQKIEDGLIQDARLFGDGYDFQIEVKSSFYLVEIKGVRSRSGSVRLTNNEFKKAREYRDDYLLVVISNLDSLPKINCIENPVVNLKLTEKEQISNQIYYVSQSIKW